MNFKFYVFIMFKMKYLITKMQCNTLSQQVWWFHGKGVWFCPKSQAIKPHKWCVMINIDKLTKYFPM
jgi:hypothetical protein